MSSGLLVRLRPSGPWRIGSSADRGAADAIYHSDSLYSAVCSAMGALGRLSEWLEATAAATDPAVRLTSGYPWQGKTLYFPTPQYGAARQTAQGAAVRLKDARFLPAAAASQLLTGQALSDRDWALDGASGCLMRKGTRYSPFRPSVRSFAGVDRISHGQILPHRAGCIEFAPGAGIWTFCAFATDTARADWLEPLQAAFRLLADSGFGGRRSIGWGHAAQPRFEETTLDALLPAPTPEPAEAEPEPEAVAANTEESGVAEPAEVPPAEPPPAAEPAPEPEQATGDAYWLLSLFCPGPAESVDWTAGSYSLLTRGGRIASDSGYGAAKRNLRMVAEGSVLRAATSPHGAAPSVAPDGFAHPVYRYGFPVALRISSEVAS